MTIRYISTFSGIEAVTVAWEPLGWEPLAFAEIDPFPCAVLDERFQDVPNLGDVTKVDWSGYAGKADLMVGGSPCFPAGTPVARYDEDFGVQDVPIESIKVGDTVLTHMGHYCKVTEVGSKVADTVVLDVERAGGAGGMVECTPNHPFYTDSGMRGKSKAWVQAKDMAGRNALAVGVMYYFGGKKRDLWYERCMVRSVSGGRKGVRVYNMSVERDNSYVAHGLAVHNCQSFSVAGKREGLDGASGLMWEWVRCVREVRPRWVVWENVPGCLSSGGGEDFRCLLRSLDDLGYDACWRVLDARFFGVPQRRRRVFLVGHIAGGRGGRHLPCEVLLEPEGLPWDTGARRKEGEGAAGGAGGRPSSAGFKSNPSGVGRSVGYEEECSPTVLSDTHSPGVLTYGIRTANTSSNGWGIQEEQSHTLGCSDRDAVAPLLVRMREGCAGGGKGPLVQRDVSGTLATGNDQALYDPCISFSDDSKVTVGMGETPTCTRSHCDCRAMVAGVKQNQRHEVTTARYTGALQASQSGKQLNGVMAEGVVRKLTPLECERLQGFPDGWTRIAWRGKPASECPDAPRYRAIGNSMAVPVMRWIGERVDACDRFYAAHPERLADLDAPTAGEQLTLF